MMSSPGQSPLACLPWYRSASAHLCQLHRVQWEGSRRQPYFDLALAKTVTFVDLLKMAAVPNASSVSLNATAISEHLLYHPPVFQHPFLFNMVCSVLMILVAVLGFVGNTIFIQLFWQSTAPSSMDILLTGLAVADNALLLSGTPVFSVIALYTYHPSDQLMRAMNYLTITLYPVSMMAHCASVWTMVLISIERYIAVCHPLAARSLCSPRKSATCLTVVCITSVVYNFCRFWEYTLDADQNVVPFLRNNELYVQVFVHWLYFVTVFGVPLFTLASVNSCIIHTIFRARRLRATMSRSQLRQHRLAVMMIVLVLIFFISNALAFVLNALEAAGFFDNMTDNRYIFYCLMDANNLLIEFNSSINLLIYLIFCRRLRSRFWLLLNCSDRDSKLQLFPTKSTDHHLPYVRKTTAIGGRNRRDSMVDASLSSYGYCRQV